MRSHLLCVALTAVALAIGAGVASAEVSARAPLSRCPALDRALDLVTKGDRRAGERQPPRSLDAATRIAGIRDRAAQREALRYYELQCDFLSGDRDV